MKKIYTLAIFMLAFPLILPNSLFAWSSPVQLSDPNYDIVWPRLSRADNGAMHMVYRFRFQPWWIAYRFRDGGGNWTPITYINNKYYVDQPDVIQDAQGRARIFYCAGDGTPWDGWTDIWEAVNNNGVWSYNKLTYTIDHRAYPRAAIDAGGMIHLVHIMWNLNNGTRGDVMYRKQTPTGWTADVSIGKIAEVWYHHPDINIDSSGAVHVVWVDTGTPKHVLRYRKRAADGTWSPVLTLGNNTGSGDSFAFPKVAWAGGNSVIAVVQMNDTLRWSISHDAGDTWSALTHLTDGYHANLETDPNGGVHLIYATKSTYGIAYRKWTPSLGWTDHLQITPNTYWQLSPDVNVDSNGMLHVVYEDNLYGTDKHLVSYINSPQDITPPNPVSSLSTLPTDGGVWVRWTNPTTYDFTGTTLRRKVGSAPADPSDGDFVTHVSATPGSQGSFNDWGLTNGNTYYYAAFAHDASYNYAAPTVSTAVPYAASIDQAKQLADGSWIRLAGRVVIGVFPADNCIYVEDPERTGGIRLAGTFSEIAVGDLVNLNGYLGVWKPDGNVLSERIITGANVSKLASGYGVIPFTMNCKTVGGGPAGTVRGVKNGSGLNSIGLLVRFAGKVTYKQSQFIFVDDGSNVENVYGIATQTTGIMVKCPSGSIPANVGDMVSVTGVAMGSVPIGWSENRSFVQIRSFDDLIKY